PGLPKLRLEGIAHGLDEAIGLLGDEAQLCVVQLKCVLAQQSGYIRLFIPGTVLSMVNPPTDGEVRRAKRAAETKANLRRLAGVKTWMRAEIGWAEIASSDLSELR